MLKEILAFDDADTNTMGIFLFNLAAGEARPYTAPRCAQCGEDLDDESQADYCDDCLQDAFDR